MERYNFVINQSPRLLEYLKDNSLPIWGEMNPQQMVEHLSLRFAFASKKIIAPPFMSNERMAFYKAKFFNKNQPIRKNFTAKGLIPSKQAVNLRFKDLQEAVSVYKSCANDFAEFFKINPIALTYHPFFGFLSYDEWLTYHEKHIKHHFHQFGLIDENGIPIQTQKTSV